MTADSCLARLGYTGGLLAAGLLLVGLTVMVARVTSPQQKEASSPCSREMFNGSNAAFWACSAQYALQRNWFPDPIQGLFSYQTWNGMDGFWQNGVVLESLANSMDYLNNTRYSSVVFHSLRTLDSLLLAYGPQPSFDDMAWYGLAYSRIAEVTGRKDFLSAAAKIFDWVWKEGWDTSICQGGVWFDQSQGFKATVENVQMIQLGARLTRLGAGGQYRARAETVWAWVQHMGLLNTSTFQVYDSISLSSCKASPGVTWTYTAGTLVGGLVELASNTSAGGRKENLELAQRVANSAIKYLTTGGVLTEPCEAAGSKLPPCNLDQNIFKGIFVRNIRYLMDALPATKRLSYTQFLQRNIASLKQLSMCKVTSPSSPLEDSSCHLVYMDGGPAYPPTGPVFDSSWLGPFKEGRPIQQTSALDLLLAGVEEGVRCKGTSCSYNPHPPPPHTLTCKDDPCPNGQDCCSFGGKFSCCNSDQTCQEGICS